MVYRWRQCDGYWRLKGIEAGSGRRTMRKASVASSNLSGIMSVRISHQTKQNGWENLAPSLPDLSGGVCVRCESLKEPKKSSSMCVECMLSAAV